LVRGLYYEGWDPTGKPERMSYEEFLFRIEDDALLKGTSEAEDAARAVFPVLTQHLGEGIMAKIEMLLPKDEVVNGLPFAYPRDSSSRPE
jgi:uncharacterized protein (DUF2267 family)